MSDNFLELTIGNLFKTKGILCMRDNKPLDSESIRPGTSGTCKKCTQQISSCLLFFTNHGFMFDVSHCVGFCRETEMTYI